MGIKSSLEEERRRLLDREEYINTKSAAMQIAANTSSPAAGLGDDGVCLHCVETSDYTACAMSAFYGHHSCLKVKKLHIECLSNI